MALETIWSAKSYRRVTSMLADFQPDVLHCYNTFPILSPAVYYAAANAGVPVVQTVQNYRLICPSATLLRDDHVCEDCVRKTVPYPGVLHACYRQNRLASATVASLLTVHRALGTWKRKVQIYLVPTHFLKSKLVEGGFHPEQVAVKPNFLPTDPGAGAGDGGYALFVGRLAPEKGLETLLRAWQHVPDLPLRIVGDGPLKARVTELASGIPNVSLEGFQPRERVLEHVKRAKMLVVPSEWYEGFPMTVVEAMGCGTPIVASDLGSLHEVVEEQVIGARFQAKNAEQLAEVVTRMHARPGYLESLRSRVRQRFAELYSAENNYPQIMTIYRQAIAAARGRDCRSRD
jgi:glycosyltransferase involved in cell wall biosynthesis